MIMPNELLLPLPPRFSNFSTALILKGYIITTWTLSRNYSSLEMYIITYLLNLCTQILIWLLILSIVKQTDLITYVFCHVFLISILFGWISLVLPVRYTSSVVHQIRKYSRKAIARAIARARMLLQLSTFALALHTMLVLWEKKSIKTHNFPFNMNNEYSFR